MSSGEYISLIAKYNKLDGNETINRLKERGFTDEQIQAAMKDDSFKPIRSLNIEFTELIIPECTYFDYYNSIYSAYLNGHLPFPGSFVEQPAKLIDVIHTFDALYSETSQKEIDKQKKELEGLKRGKQKR